MQDLRFVTFETCNATFTFEIADAIAHLKPYAELGVREASELMKAILDTSSTAPTIKVTADYFGFIVLDLIKVEKGDAYCKVCNKIYHPGQLVTKPVGFGNRNPFSVNLKEKGGIFTRFFERKKRICGSGVEGYLCPHGHVLIRMITWTGLFQTLNKERR
jgi:hypothetical protein